MKYRIKKVKYKNGSERFYPQRKFLWFWIGDRCANTLTIAEQYIEMWAKEKLGKVVVEYINYPENDTETN